MDEREQAERGAGSSEPDVDSEASAVERRRDARYPVTLEATCQRMGHHGATVDTATVDLSHRGARIVAPAGTAVGDVVQVTVPMPDGIELTLQGLVVQISHTAGHHAHLAFDSQSITAAGLLLALVLGPGLDADGPAPHPEG